MSSEGAQETQIRVKNAVDHMVDELDKKYLRDMQRMMFTCSARCCEDKIGSRGSVENCVDVCNLSMKKAQTALENELTTLQSQLSRCSMTCYDKQIRKFGPDPNKYKENDLKAFSKNLDKCVSDCATEHISILPQIKERFVSSLQL